MAHYHFFTENTILSGNPKVFGPLPAPDDETKYRVTSGHTAGSNPNAYAVCDGFVLVQPVYETAGDGSLTGTASSTLVNLILKPTQEPDFNFVPVKYFIYRGVRRADIINDGVSPKAVAAQGTSQFVDLFWESQSKIDSNAPNASATGIDMMAGGNQGYEHADPLFTAFHRTGDFQLIQVKRGMTLGKFDKNSIGFEVVLDRIGNNPTFDVARRLDHIITVPAIPASPTKKDVFEHYHKKEKVLDYMDPAAFFGSFYRYGLFARNSGNTDFEKKDANGIYDAVVSKFGNKNIVYVDIRNEYNDSLDYMKNYGDFETNYQTTYNVAVKIGLDPNNDTTASRNYNNFDGRKWPIMTFKASDFPANSSEKNIIRLSLPEGDNTKPLVYLVQGYLYNGFPRQPRDVRSKFIDVEPLSGFTAPTVKIAAGNREGQGAATPIACYIRLNYFKQIDSPQASEKTVIRAQHYLDHLFLPFAMRIPFSASTGYRSVVYNDPVFVDGYSKIGKSFVARVGMAEDAYNYTFFAYATEVYRSDRGETKHFAVVGERNAGETNFLEGLVARYTRPDGIGERELQRSKLEIGAGPVLVDYLDYSQPDIDLTGTFDAPDFDELIAISVKKDELDTTLKNLRDNNLLPDYKTYLGLVTVNTGVDNKNYDYTEATLVLRGYEVVGTVIQYREAASAIKIYTEGAL